MSEKGLLSKSIANNISEAIIDKLGGTGYAPTEWSKNINLLGIASADVEEALASITEDASSSDKGLLSLSIASDMGAILNKKYNTSRGFKPSEVSSAVSMLSPLPEKTASGAIAVIEDGADDVPTKSLVVTIPPTLSGVSAVSETQTGRNLASELLEWNATNRIISPIFLKSGTYTVSFQRSVSPSAIYIRKGDTIRLGGDAYATKYNSAFFTFTADESTYYYVQICRSASSTTWEEAPVTNVQIEYGSTAHAYEPYQTPETKTADLGRAVYGGSADIIKGEGKEAYKNYVLDNLTWSGGNVQGNWCWYVVLADDGLKLPENSAIFEGICDNYVPIRYNGVGTTENTIALRSTGYLYVNNGSNTVQPTGKVTIELATPEDFTFDGQEIPTRLGYNAFWSDQGDTEVTYRADLDLYEAPSMLLEANNTETEGNEEQEGNE